LYLLFLLFVSSFLSSVIVLLFSGFNCIFYVFIFSLCSAVGYFFSLLLIAALKLKYKLENNLNPLKLFYSSSQILQVPCTNQVLLIFSSHHSDPCCHSFHLYIIYSCQIHSCYYFFEQLFVTSITRKK
jgi:hypothetical protein